MNGSSRVIVVGASAGGFQALRELLAQLPASLPAAVFMVLHIAPHFSGEDFVDNLQAERRTRAVLGRIRPCSAASRGAKLLRPRFASGPLRMTSRMTRRASTHQRKVPAPALEQAAQRDALSRSAVE